MLRWIGRWWRERGTKATGRAGERAAARHLRRLGYRILGRNLTCSLGEIDLLAEAPDGRTLVVVEVKASAAGAGGPRPEEHVNAAKQRKLVQLAGYWARRLNRTDRPVRFDVIGVDLMPKALPRIRHHPGAFEARV